MRSILLLCLSIFGLTVAFSKCLNQKDFNMEMKINNESNVQFNIERKDNEPFNVLSLKQGEPIEIKGFLLSNNKIDNPKEMKVEDLIRLYGSKNTVNEVYKISQKHKILIVEKAVWKNHKDIKIKISNLSDSKNMEKKYINLFIVLIHNNKNECSYFESNKILYDFKNKEFLK